MRAVRISSFAFVLAALIVAAVRPYGSSAVAPVEGETTLYGVAATSSANAWAVGTTGGSRTLIERWNGTAWKRQPSPSPGRTRSGAPFANELFGVAATSRSNAWTVGDSYAGTGIRKTLVEHWGGNGWTVQRSPSPATSNIASNMLYAVAATSVSNAWAVGNYAGRRANRSLILHWNGSAWKVQKSPNVVRSCSCSYYDVLYGVAATSPSNAWAVGYYRSDLPKRSGAVIEHWDGSAWTVQKTIPSPHGIQCLKPGSCAETSTFAVLHAITAVSPSDVWAVGEADPDPQFPETVGQTLILHWNGTTWEQQESLNPSNALYGVAATSASNVWVVGPGIWHLDGASWQPQKSPNPGAKSNIRQGVAATSAGDAWAVGQYTGNSRGNFFSRPLIQHWNGTAWK